MSKPQYTVRKEGTNAWSVVSPVDQVVCDCYPADNLSAEDNARRIAQLLNNLYGYNVLEG